MIRAPRIPLAVYVALAASCDSPLRSMAPVPGGEVQQIQRAAPIQTTPPPIGPCGDVDCCLDCVDDACFTRTCNFRTGDCRSIPKCKTSAQCKTATCDPMTGCQEGNAPDGTACTGNACMVSTTCVAGVCTGSPRNCPAPLVQCQTASCDPTAGCTVRMAPDGTGCDIGDKCFPSDTCVNGSCTHGPPKVCPAMPCKKPGGCSGGACSYQNDDGASCSDGDVCNGAEVCSGGGCVKGSGPLDCKDSNPCTSDSCDPKTGCSVTNVKDGTVCAPPTECGAASTCQAGVCTAAPTQKSCDDHNPCTADSCGANQSCQHVNLDGTSCSDGDPCNGEERCSMGVCKPGTPLSCPAPRPCHRAGSCDGKSGMCSDPLAPDGTGCDDGNPCTSGDACHAGACTGTPTTAGACGAPRPDAAVDARGPADAPADEGRAGVDAPVPPSPQDGAGPTGQPGGPGPNGAGGTVSDDGAAGTGGAGAVAPADAGTRVKGVAIGGCSLGRASPGPCALIVLGLLAGFRGGRRRPPSSPAG